MSACRKHLPGIFSLVAVALASSPAAAQPYGGYPGWGGAPAYENSAPEPYAYSPRGEQSSPLMPLRDGIARLTRFLDGKPNPGAVASYLDREVASWFDFDYMAEWAAGRRADRYDDAVLADVARRLRASFLQKMAQKLSRYSHQRPIFLAPVDDGPGQITLPVVIENPAGAYPSRLEFRMRQTDKGWRVIDVAANGMSALLYYRETFNDMMRQRPPRPY